MDIQNNAFTVKQFISMIGRDTVRFDYPIQRSAGQWKVLQQSLLINSLARSYPIPPLYFVGYKEDQSSNENAEKSKKSVAARIIRSVIDGMQRLTSIMGYINREYKLDAMTPEAVIDGIEYQLAGKYFDELDEEVQDMILSRSLLTYTIDRETATDEEIEDLFYRLNNGSELSTQQKAKALMGTKWATKMKKLADHVLVRELSAFSKNQIIKEGHLTAITQTMMMLDESYEYKNVQQGEISSYMSTFREDESQKEKLYNKVKEAMDFLVEVFSQKEKLLLKKVHFPMTLITALRAKELGVEPEVFHDWAMSFKEAFKPSKKRDGTENTITILPTDYKKFTDKGTTDRDKADGRMNEMIRHFNEYLKMHNLPS
ncbi:DUF262 domain-containing protein [Bacillus inaquosorum]|uniref:DUF262 domain-containing protein n=1 Tax=Bacillus inaquosorum TaxID=483913 RepID=UPI003D21398A